MPLKYPYADAFLAPRVTQAREDQAISYVATLGTLPAAWVPILVTLKAYMVTCVECLQGTDDTFSAKLAAYRKDFDAALVEARAAQATAGAGGNSLLNAEASHV